MPAAASFSNSLKEVHVLGAGFSHSLIGIEQVDVPVSAANLKESPRRRHHHSAPQDPTLHDRPWYSEPLDVEDRIPYGEYPLVRCPREWPNSSDRGVVCLVCILVIRLVAPSDVDYLIASAFQIPIDVRAKSLSLDHRQFVLRMAMVLFVVVHSTAERSASTPGKRYRSFGHPQTL